MRNISLERNNMVWSSVVMLLLVVSFGLLLCVKRYTYTAVETIDGYVDCFQKTCKDLTYDQAQICLKMGRYDLDRDMDMRACE